MKGISRNTLYDNGSMNKYKYDIEDNEDNRSEDKTTDLPNDYYLKDEKQRKPKGKKLRKFRHSN